MCGVKPWQKPSSGNVIMVSKWAWQHYQLGNVLISESWREKKFSLGLLEWVCCLGWGPSRKIYANECEKSDWGSEHVFQICKTVKTWSKAQCTRDDEMRLELINGFMHKKANLVFQILAFLDESHPLSMKFSCKTAFCWLTFCKEGIKR